MWPHLLLALPFRPLLQMYTPPHAALRASHCPVCNENFEPESLVTCQPIYHRNFEQAKQNQIIFDLKAKQEGQSMIYDAATLKEDTRFAKVIKATTPYIKQIYET